MGVHDEARLDTKFTEFAKQMNLYLNHCHSRKTGSFRHLMKTLKKQKPALYEQLPQSWREVVASPVNHKAKTPALSGAEVPALSGVEV